MDIADYLRAVFDKRRRMDLRVLALKRSDHAATVNNSQTGIGESCLILIFAPTIFIGDITVFIRLKENNLPDAFIDVNAQGEVGQVGEFDDETARPPGFERRGIDE